MSVERFQTSADGIDPVEYIAAYFTHFTPKEISVLVGAIALLENIELKILQSVLELDKIDLEEKIGRLMQSDLLEGRFTETHFQLQQFNYQIKKQHPNLTLDDRVFLAYLKARFQLSIEELQTAFDLSYASTIYLLSGFISKGLITPQKVNETEYQFVVHYQFPKRNASAVTDFEAQLVGYFQLKGVTSIPEVSKELAEPEHKVLSTFVTLILSDMITATFSTSTSIFGGMQLNISVDKFQIFFEKSSIQVLTNNERDFIGYLSLRKSASLKDIAKVISLHPVDVLKLGSKLLATGQFIISMEGDTFTVREYRPMSINRSIEVLNQIYGFNYRVLLGILQTQQKISIKELSNIMKLEQEAILNGLISSYIEGLVDGHLSDRDVFTLVAVRQQEQKSVMTLENWERIILGGLISEKVMPWPKIAALLEIDRETARNRGFEFISHSISKTTAKDRVLFIEEVPQLPPLTQVSALRPLERQILGYLKLSNEIQIKDIGSKFKLSNIEVFRQLYFLTGSGLIQLNRNRNKFQVKDIFQNEPQQSVNELDLVKQQIIRAIELESENEIKLKIIAKTVELKYEILEKHLFEIIALGFYRGTLRKQTLYREGVLNKSHDAGICLYCTSSLELGATTCQSCNRRLPDCGVCKGTLNSNEQLLTCPHCKNQNHAVHIKQWLQIKGECPFCRNKVSVTQLLVQQPLL